MRGRRGRRRAAARRMVAKDLKGRDRPKVDCGRKSKPDAKGRSAIEVEVSWKLLKWTLAHDLCRGLCDGGCA